MSPMDYVNWQEASDDLNAMRDAAANLVMDKIESGAQPTEDELRAAGLCVKCAGFGYVDFDVDGFTEIPCDLCNPKINR